MSRTIDEKVVEMRFDNSDFERNVTQSMSTLDKLKGALDFSGASKAFDGITSAANKVSFGGLTGALDGVSEKFSALETIATGALLNIGRKVEDFVTNQVKSLTLEPVMEGFGKYASKTSSVQMIMNAIRDGTKSDAELMEEVNGQLERLMWYTDETSYDFTEMTASIGKFTSAGIGLEEAVTAMEGIANLAGISGATKAEANRAMYNISQALSGGFMRLQDWKSIENANMATKEFKEMLIKAAIDRGTLEEAVDEAGNTIWGVSTKSGFNEVNYKTVASTLTEGKWLTNEVLTDTLAMYGAFTDELSKVYDDINENADVTTSQIIKMTNQWKEGTLDMSKAMAMTGKSAEELEAIFASLGRDEYDLGRRAFAAAQEAKTFQEAIDATKDAVSTGWMKTFELLFGNYEEAKVLWTDLANELWDIFAGPISDINDVLTAWRNNDDLGDGRDDLIEGLKNIYRAARSVIDPITEAWNAIFPPATYRDVWDFTHRFKEFTDSLIRSEEQVERIQQTFEGFFRGIEKIKDGVGGLIGAFKEGFESGGGIGGFVDGIAMAANQVGDTIYELTIGMSRVRGVLKDYREGNLLDSGVVDDILEQFPLAAKLVDTYENLIGIYDKLADTFGAVGKAFGKMFDLSMFFKDGVLTFDSYIDGLKTKFASILELVTEVVHIWTGEDISRLTDSVRNFVFDIYDEIKALVGHEGWGKIKEELRGVGTAFTETFGGIKEFFGPAWQAAVTIFNDWLTGLRTILGGTSGDLDGFFGTITDGLQSVQDFIRNNEGFANFINGIKEGIQFISDFLVRFLSLTDAIEVYQANGGGILGILAVINDKIGIIIDTFADLVQNVTGFDIHGIGDSILDVIQGIGYAVLQVADTISKAFGWTDNPFGKLLRSIDEGFGGPEGEGFDLSGIFDRVGDAFSRFGELVNKVAPGISVLLRTVGDAFKNLWELIGQIRLEDLIRIFQGIASIMLMFQGKKTLAELGDTLEAYQKKLKADMLFAIAGSILMIAGAALMISKIDAEKIGLVLGTLGVSFAGLIGMMVASKWANPKALAALPGTVLAIAAAMVILAKAAEMMTGPIQAFADMENFWGGMGKLGTVMGSFLAMLGILGALNQSGAVLGASKALGKLAGVMALMLPIVFAYSKIDFEKLAGGVGKLLTALSPLLAVTASLSVMQALLSKFIHEINLDELGSGLLKISGALAILTAVIFALTYLGWDDFFSALGKMALGFAAITAAIAAFSFGVAILGPVMGLLDKFASSLLKLGTAILFISAGVGLLGIIATILGDSAQAIAEAGVGLIVTVLDAIVARTPEIAEDIVLFILGVLDAVADHTPEIIDACVRIIGGIMEGVRMALAEGGIQLGDLFAGGGILAGLIGLVWLLKKMKLNVGDFANAALALAGAGLLLVEIGAIFYGIGKLSSLVGGVEGINQFGEFCTAIVNVFREDWGVGALFAAVAAMIVLTDKLGLKPGQLGSIGSLIGIIAEVGLVIEAIGGIFAIFGAAVAGLDWLIEAAGGPEDGIVKAIQKFGDMAIAISDVIGGVIGHLVGGIAGGIAGGAIEGAMKGYADGLKYIANTSGEFFTLMDGLKPGTLEGCKLFAEMITELTKADILDSLWIFNGKVDYEKFADGLKDLAPGIAAFAEQTRDIDQSSVEKAAACAEMIIAFAKDIPNDGGMISWFTGNNNLGDFAKDLALFAPSLSAFSMNAKFIDQEAVEKAAACADMIIAFAKEVPNDGGLIWLIAGDNRLKDFAEDLAAFGPALSTFSMNAKYINQEAVEKAAACADMIIAFAKEVPNNGGMITWFTGDNSLDSFGANLVKFGKSLVSYSQTLSSEDFSLQVIRNTNSAIETVIDMANSVAGKDGKGMPDVKDFGEKLKSFGSSFADYYNKVKDIDSTKVDNLSGAVSRMVKSFVGSEDTSLAGQVAKFTSDFLDKLSSTFGGSESKKKSEESADKFIDFFKGRFSNDTSVNKVSVSISDMFSKAVGKDELKEGLKQSGLDLVGQLQNGITEAFEGEEGLSVKFASFLESLLTSIATDGQNGTKARYYNAGADLIKSLMNGMLNEEKISGFGSPAALQLKEGFKALLDSLIGLIVSEEMRGQFNRGGASLINAMLGGIKSVDVETEMKSVGKNATLGYANGMVDQEALKQVAKSAKAATDVGISTAKTNLAEKSPSRVTMLIGQYFTQGFANGIYNKIPNAKEAVLTLMQKVKEGMGQNDLISLANKLGLNLDGALDDHIANLISQHGLDDFLNGDLDEMANSIMGALSNGEIYSGSGTESWDAWMSSFQTEYENSIPDLESMAQGIPEVFGSTMQEYANNGSVTNGVNTITDNVSGVLSECYDTSGDYGYGTVYNYADNVLTASEEVQPILTTATENMTAPVEEGLAEMLSYAEWVAKQYPEGLTKELSVPTMNFDDLYENMKGGELEAILNMFDAMSDADRSKLIRAYGLGEEGGNADLANYLQWYWNNEPTRIQNLESIKQATEGYQAYLDEQKALQEAQAIQSQKNYEGVQQIAAGMNERADAADAKYMAAIEEIKMTVKSIEEELDSVHATISELNNMDVYIDSNALVGATAEKYNEELGNMAKIGRRRVTR